MRSHDPLPLAPSASDGQTEEEIRTLLLRLLRLIAVEVAEQLRSGERPIQPEDPPLVGPDAEATNGDTRLRPQS